jgi:hypothetical protein
MERVADALFHRHAYPANNSPLTRSEHAGGGLEDLNMSVGRGYQYRSDPDLTCATQPLVGQALSPANQPQPKALNFHAPS